LISLFSAFLIASSERHWSPRKIEKNLCKNVSVMSMLEEIEKKAFVVQEE